MTGEKNQQVPLTDSEYIEWAKKHEWSLTQALYLIHGFVPPKSDQTEKQLLSQFRDVEKLILQYAQKMNPKLPESIRAEYPGCPKSWLGSASLDGLDLTDSWKAIFPMSVREPLNSILDGKKIKVTSSNPRFQMYVLCKQRLCLCKQTPYNILIYNSNNLMN